MNNLDKAKKELNQLYLATASFDNNRISEILELASMPTWYNAKEKTPFKECDVRIYNILEKRYSTAKYKNGYFEYGYINNTPICLNEKEYINIFWCEMPSFYKA